MSDVVTMGTPDAVALQLYWAAPQYADSGTYTCGCCEPDHLSSSSVELLVAAPGIGWPAPPMEVVSLLCSL